MIVSFSVHYSKVEVDVVVFLVPVVGVENSSIDFVGKSVFTVDQITGNWDGVVDQPLLTDNRLQDISTVNRFSGGRCR